MPFGPTELFGRRSVPDACSSDPTMPPGTFEILTGLAFAALLLVALLAPAYGAAKDVSGAVDVVATTTDEGVLVRMKRFPRTKGVMVTAVGVSRALADELGLEVPDGYRLALDHRWLTAEGRTRLRDPVELLFPATRAASRPVSGVLRVVSRYRPGIRRIRHYIQVNIDPAGPERQQVAR